LSTKKPKKTSKIEIAKHPEFRVITANQFFGGLFPNEGQIQFYTDIIEAQMKADESERMEAKKISRELQVEIRLSPMDFKRLANWMNSHIKRVETEDNLKEKNVAKSKLRNHSIV
jgi:hypothetical protein